MDDPLPNPPHLAAMDMTAVPPYDADAEAAVLGACMFSPDIVDAVRNPP